MSVLVGKIRPGQLSGLVRESYMTNCSVPSSLSLSLPPPLYLYLSSSSPIPFLSPLSSLSPISFPPLSFLSFSPCFPLPLSFSPNCPFSYFLFPFSLFLSFSHSIFLSFVYSFCILPFFLPPSSVPPHLCVFPLFSLSFPLISPSSLSFYLSVLLSPFTLLAFSIFLFPPYFSLYPSCFATFTFSPSLSFVFPLRFYRHDSRATVKNVHE